MSDALLPTRGQLVDRYFRSDLEVDNFSIANNNYGNTRVGSPPFSYLLHCRAEAGIIECNALGQKSER